MISTIPLSGIYECFVENEGGTAHAAAQLLVDNTGEKEGGGEGYQINGIVHIDGIGY